MRVFTESTKVESHSLSLVRQFDIVLGRVGRAALLISFVAGLIWATASSEDYPLIVVFPLLAILVTRLVGGWLGGFVGYVAKYALGWFLAWIAVLLLLFFTRLGELPKDFWEGASAASLPETLYSNITWTTSLLLAFLCATACELGLALIAAVMLCVRRALRLSPASLQPGDRRHWYQLSLKTVLLLVLTFTVGMGWFATRANRARANRERVGNVDDAVAAIEKLGGRVATSRDDKREPTWLEELFDDPGNPDDPNVVVEIRHVELTGVDSIKLLINLNHLHSLSISSAHLTDVEMQHIIALEELEFLRLDNTQAAYLNGLDSLRTLDLVKTQVTGSGPTHLPGLWKLRELALGDSTGFFEHSRGTPTLTNVTLNHKDTDASLKHLNRTSLWKIILWRSDVTDEGLSHIEESAELQELSLDFTSIGDTGLIHVSGLTALERLRLVGTNVTDRGMVHLKGLEQLRFLHLTATDVGDAGLEHLQGLEKLEELYLSNTQVASAGLAHVRRMPNLVILYLEDTQVGDAGLTHVKTLPKLEELNLAHTQVTSAGLFHLKSMSHLRDLDLQGTKVDDAGLEHLTGLTELWSLSLEDTMVTDAGVTKLQQALPTCSIYR